MKTELSCTCVHHRTLLVCLDTFQIPSYSGNFCGYCHWNGSNKIYSRICEISALMPTYYSLAAFYVTLVLLDCYAMSNVKWLLTFCGILVFSPS